MSQTVDFASCLAPSKCESISPLDDLAFDMYQDPEVAHIIRLLDQKKQDMVRQGKNEQSKTLKQAIADLQKVSLLAGGNRMRLKTQFFFLTWLSCWHHRYHNLQSILEHYKLF